MEIVFRISNKSIFGGLKYLKKTSFSFYKPMILGFFVKRRPNGGDFFENEFFRLAKGLWMYTDSILYFLPPSRLRACENDVELSYSFFLLNIIFLKLNELRLNPPSL